MFQSLKQTFGRTCRMPGRRMPTEQCFMSELASSCHQSRARPARARCAPGWRTVRRESLSNDARVRSPLDAPATGRRKPRRTFPGPFPRALERVRVPIGNCTDAVEQAAGTHRRVTRSQLGAGPYHQRPPATESNGLRVPIEGHLFTARRRTRAFGGRVSHVARGYAPPSRRGCGATGSVSHASQTHT
jgi:hypothetical protein